MNILDIYKGLVPFLGESLGKDCEVVLHDFREPGHSVIAIANGNISGRHVGAPATDFILKLLQRDKKNHQQSVTNYYGKSFNGHTLRSSTYFIHDEQGESIGALCLNYDVQHYVEVRKQLDQLILMYPAKRIDENKGDIFSDDIHSRKVEISESMYPTVDDVIQNLIQRALEPFETETGRLSLVERISIVEELYKNGLFVLKGSVYALAKVLEVSEPTIYRYLNRVKKNITDRQ